MSAFWPGYVNALFTCSSVKSDLDGGNKNRAIGVTGR